MEEVINRYGRQELIEGWNQEKIGKSKVAIIGSGHIANFVSADLAALGVGDIKVYDDTRAFYEVRNVKHSEREFLTSRLSTGRSNVEELEKKLRKINPLVDIYGIQMELDDITEKFLGKPDMIVSCTNDLDVISRYYRYASDKEIPMYIVQGDKKGAFFTRKYSNIKDYSGREQEGVVSEVISGILSGEILKKLMKQESLDSFAYFPSGSRFNLEGKIEKSEFSSSDLKSKKALVIGAGALGNFLGIGLSHAGIGKIYLADDDDIETTNLNRQILFYEKVGEGKAATLAERLMEINPDLEVEPIRKRVDENFEEELKKMKPDVIIDCVDNLATRAILNHFAVRYKIPLISGGTDFQAGQTVVYEPGKSSCLNCRLGADHALVEARTSQSCLNAPTPSVVITNHIIGGLMAAEARCVLDPEHYGPAVEKTMKYDSTKSNRAGLIGSDKPCECKRRTSAESWIKKLIPPK
jgi:molybdopterin-synthase adenylyltransferase